MPAKLAPIAKVAPPSLSSVFPRQRLFELFDTAQKHPALWVSGLPGSGKTTAVASYVQARRRPCLWYQVDATDEDGATLFHFLRVAAESLEGEPIPGLPELKPEHLAELQSFAIRFFIHLYQQLPAGTLLVFDNLHRLPPETATHQLLRIAIEQLPAGLNLLLVSQREPPPALAPLELSGRLGRLPADALNLSSDEAAGVAALNDTWRERPEAVESLFRHTRGWLAGFKLLLEYSDPQRLPLPVADPMTRETFFNFFAGEIFDHMEEDTRKFLLATACLPLVEVATARALSGFDNAEILLEGLSRRNYFTERREGTSGVFIYHPLFREFLMWRARETLGAGFLAGQRRHAAELLDEAGQWEEALGLYQAIEDWQAFAALLLRQAPSLLGQSRFQSLGDWLLLLPEPVRNGEPWLNYWLGTALLPIHPPRSRACFEQAFRGFEARGESAGTILAASGVIETALVEWGEFTFLDDWIQRLEAIFQPTAALQVSDTEARAIFSMFTALMFRSPQHSAMATWMERMFALLNSDVDRDLRIQIGTYLSLYHYWIGDLALAEHTLSMSRQLAKTCRPTALALINLAMQEAVLHWHRARFDACITTVERGLAQAEENGVHILDNWLYAQSVYACLARGDLATAHNYLHRMQQSLVSHRHLDVCHFNYLFSLYHLQSGQARLAQQHVSLALQLAQQVGTPFPEGLVAVAAAQIFLAGGAPKSARAFNERALRIADDMGSILLEILGQFNEAWFALEAGDDQGALVPLRRGLELTAAAELRNLPGWRSDMMARLCAAGLRAGIEVDYLRGLIRARQILPPPGEPEPEDWPWAVEVRTLGGFSLDIQGEAYRPAGKVQKKPLQLLKLLVAMGEEQIPQELLCDLLWPDADGDRAQRSLITTLSRLRQLLGDSEALEFHGGRISLNQQLCRSDLGRLRRLAAEFGRLAGGPARDPARAAALTDRMLTLCRGDFLAGDPDRSLCPVDNLPQAEILDRLARFWAERRDARRLEQIQALRGLA